jgi:hypothetical protein
MHAVFVNNSFVCTFKPAKDYFWLIPHQEIIHKPKAEISAGKP